MTEEPFLYIVLLDTLDPCLKYNQGQGDKQGDQNIGNIPKVWKVVKQKYAKISTSKLN